MDYIECVECDERFKNVHELRRHICVDHLEYIPFTCRECKEKFSTFRTFSDHHDAMHGEKIEPSVSLSGIFYSTKIYNLYLIKSFRYT